MLPVEAREILPLSSGVMGLVDIPDDCRLALLVYLLLYLSQFKDFRLEHKLGIYIPNFALKHNVEV